jgi:hypothetical protein
MLLLNLIENLFVLFGMRNGEKIIFNLLEF